MTHPADLTLRHLRPEDHAPLHRAIPEWWETPDAVDLSHLLPRLFVEHVTDPSWVLEDSLGALRAFLVAFESQSACDVAEVHVGGVHPSLRRSGTATLLHAHAFACFCADGRSRIRCITGPATRASQASHTARGFQMLPGDREVDGNHRLVGLRRAGAGPPRLLPRPVAAERSRGPYAGVPLTVGRDR